MLFRSEGYYNLIKLYGLTQEDLAQRIGKSQSSIANKLRLLKLDDETKDALTKYSLSERHARALLRLPTEKERKRVLDAICERGLNVRQTDELVCNSKNFTDLRIFTKTITQAINMMCAVGINATSQRFDNKDCIEYIIRIKK